MSLSVSIMNIVPTYPQADLPHPLLPQLRQIGNSGHCDSCIISQWQIQTAVGKSENKISNINVCTLLCGALTTLPKRKKLKKYFLTGQLQCASASSEVAVPVRNLTSESSPPPHSHTYTHRHTHTHTQEHIAFSCLWILGIDYYFLFAISQY